MLKGVIFTLCGSSADSSFTIKLCFRQKKTLPKRAELDLDIYQDSILNTGICNLLETRKFL